MCIGRKPVEEALLAGKDIDRIFMQRKSSGSGIAEIQQLAAEHNVPINYVPKEKLAKFTNLRHQGVVALLSAIKYYQVENIIDFCYAEGKDPLVVVLDGVTDVGNFGAICRTALGLEVDAVVIGQHNAAAINETAIKASAGAIHHLKICRHKNLEQVVEYLKQYGLTINSLAGSGDKIIYEVDFSGPQAIVMGAEGRGVSKSMLELSDNICKIPMNNQLESYNVSVATAIVLYEMRRGN